MKYFNHFFISELFVNCSKDEISKCVRLHCFDNLLCILDFLDSFREFIETPIVITSSFRDEAHNALVGGVPNSQHCLGEAIDFYAPKMPIMTLWYLLQDFIKTCPFGNLLGQIILYDNFIHIGIRTQYHKNLVYYDKRTSKNLD